VRRWLPPICHAAVGVWFLVALAGVIVAGTHDPAPASERLARVWPVVPDPPPAVDRPATPLEAEPEIEPEVGPGPEPAREPEPELRDVGATEIARGSALLDGDGSFPALSFDYDAFPSFAAYARAMSALGARFVVVRRREIVGAIELESRAIVDFDLGAGYSPRARDYTGEPGLRPLAAAAKERFGERASVMMLLPRRIDAGLFGGLAQALDEKREPRAGVREIRGRYERGPGGGVQLRVEAAVRRDGSSLPLDARFDLGRIARGGAA